MTFCQECGYDWSGPASHAVATIQALPALLATLLREAGIGDGDRRLRTRPAPEVWSPLEYIGHLGDAIDWYSGRVERVLTEQRARLDGFDWDLHTARQAYHRRRLDDVVATVNRSAERFSLLTAELPDAAWEREGVGSDGTPRGTAQLARRAAHEAHHHVHDLRVQLPPASP